jgi:hypothetical protein
MAKYKILIILILIILANKILAQDPCPYKKASNETVILDIKDLQKICASVFNCKMQADSSAEVIHCTKSVANYPKPVHLYIPTSLDLSKKVETFVHFHGHNIGYDHFHKTKIPGEGYGDYGNFLSSSNVNGILAVPESDGNCNTYDSYFANPKNANAFLESIRSSSKAKETTLHLSGHSGAYRVLNRLASFANDGSVENLKDLHSIGLFDATYGSIAHIETWTKNHYRAGDKFLFYNTFIDGPKATASKISLELKEKYKTTPSDSIVFKPVHEPKEMEGVLQHFNVLRDGSLKNFFMLAEKR